MRRALQYNAITGRTIAVHCEEQSLTRGGHAHAGAVAAELGIGGWPSLGESLMVARDVDLAADTGQPVHLMHLSARESVEHLRRAQAAGIACSGEATPHHLCLTDEAIRTLDPNLKMNPPLRTELDRTLAPRRGPRRHDRGDRDRPRSAQPGGEGRPVRVGAVRCDRASRRRSPCCTPSSSSPACSRSRRCSSECRPARPRSSGSTGRASPSAHPANLTLLDLESKLARQGRRLPLALVELVAARSAADRPRAADDRRRDGWRTE